MTDGGIRKWEVGSGNSECGNGKKEVGMRRSEKLKIRSCHGKIILDNRKILNSENPEIANYKHQNTETISYLQHVVKKNALSA
jgi:hypothetical protein